MAEKRHLSDQALEAVKQLVPWNTAIPWYVVFIEGVVVRVIGILVVVEPSEANVKLTLALSAGLVVAGLMQIWGIVRDDEPDRINSTVAARAGIAVYAGLLKAT